MSTPNAPLRPVVNVTHKPHGGPVRKFARIVFPEGSTRAQVAATLARFPEADGFRCDLRQIGPQGFSLPLDMAGLSH